MSKSDQKLGGGTRLFIWAVICCVLLLLSVLFLASPQIKPAFSENGIFQLTKDDLIEHTKSAKWTMPVDEISSTKEFLDYIENPPNTCPSSVIIGGRKCHEYDEHLVCLEKSLEFDHEDCLVYSFGAGSGSFENGMTKLGCQVYTFDPTMSSRTDRRTTDRSWLMGVRLAGNDSAALPGDRIMSLVELRRTLGHRSRRIDYLKLDIDGEEWSALTHMMSSTVLKHVQQIAIQAVVEVSHLTPQDRLRRIKELYQVLIGMEYSGLHLVSSKQQGDREHHCHIIPEPELPKDRPLCDYFDLLFVRKI